MPKFRIVLLILLILAACSTPAPEACPPWSGLSGNCLVVDHGPVSTAQGATLEGNGSIQMGIHSEFLLDGIEGGAVITDASGAELIAGEVYPPGNYVVTGNTEWKVYIRAYVEGEFLSMSEDAQMYWQTVEVNE